MIKKNPEVKNLMTLSLKTFQRESDVREIGVPPSKQLSHVQLLDDSYQIVVALEGTRQATPGLSNCIEYGKG
jgi:hypothetical protein